MKKEIPVIILRGEDGSPAKRLTVREWLEHDELIIPKTPQDLELKLYRSALDYLQLKENDKAEDLLIHLCECCDYSRFEYIERLANLYRNQKQLDKERCILLIAKHHVNLQQLLPRIDKRLARVDQLMSEVHRQLNWHGA